MQRTAINGEQAQAPGPGAAPAKKPLPLKRGVRRGDVLLMVAKLDPDAAKPEPRTQPRDAPAGKTPSPATDPGGGKDGKAPPTPRGPQASTEDAAPKAEKTQTGGSRDPATVPVTQGEKDQGTAGTGGEAPQTKGLKGGEPQGKEGPGEGGRPGTVEKEGADSTNKMAKGTLSKDPGGEGKLAGAQPQVKKWGGSLGRRSRWEGPQKKDKEGALLSKAGKTGESQVKAEKVDKLRGKVGEAPRVTEEARGPHRESGEAGEAGAKTQKGGEAPKKVGAAGKESPKVQGKAEEAPRGKEEARGPPSESGTKTQGLEVPEEVSAAGKESRTDGRGQEAEGPCGSVNARAGARETELEAPRPPALESHAERPQRRENQEGPALQEGSEGSQSGDLDQVRGCSPAWGAVGGPSREGGMGSTCPGGAGGGAGEGQGIGEGWPAQRRGQALPPGQGRVWRCPLHLSHRRGRAHECEMPPSWLSLQCHRAALTRAVQ